MKYQYLEGWGRKMATSSRPAWALEGDCISKVKIKQKKESWQFICVPTYIKKSEHFTEYQGKVFFTFYLRQ